MSCCRVAAGIGALFLLLSLTECAPEAVGDRDGGTVAHATDPFTVADSYCGKINRDALIGTYDTVNNILTFDCIARN